MISRHRRSKLLMTAGLIFLLMTVGLSAQTDPKISRGEYLTLKIAVFGPGDPLYVWWGHIGLIIEDSLSGSSIFYDYGLFSFENENFFLNFAFGRLLYSCGASPAKLNIDRYRNYNRDITLYTLDLSPKAKEKVWRFAENNLKPENRNYYYHQFDDNCSTRIRDIIDLAVDGQFREFTDRPGRMTLREHVRRHTWFNPFFDWFLMFIMGKSIDQPITVWDEMFLPSEVGRNIEDFTYMDEQGNMKKLVSSKELYYQAVNRHAVKDVPPKQWIYELFAGLILAGLLFYLRKGESIPRERALGAFNIILGLFLGSAGTIVCFMSFFTNHDYSWNNLNVFFINPLLFSAVPAGITLAFSRKKEKRAKAGRFLPILWGLMFTSALITAAAHIFPGVSHDNSITLAFFLPMSLAMSLFINPLLKSRQ